MLYYNVLWTLNTRMSVKEQVQTILEAAPGTTLMQGDMIALNFQLSQLDLSEAVQVCISFLPNSGFGRNVQCALKKLWKDTALNLARRDQFPERLVEFLEVKPDIPERYTAACFVAQLYRAKVALNNNTKPKEEDLVQMPQTLLIDTSTAPLKRMWIGLLREMVSSFPDDLELMQQLLRLLSRESDVEAYYDVLLDTPTYRDRIVLINTVAGRVAYIQLGF